MAEPFIGEIRSFSFGVIPQGWMACNGQILQVKQNQALFVILGNRYGGDGVTTFALPNLQGRVPMGAQNSSKPGPSGGEEAHVLTVNEMPQHTHDAYAGADATDSNPEGNVWGTSAALASYSATTNAAMSPNALATAGSSAAHPNMQPYLALNYCIAITGIFPPKN